MRNKEWLAFARRHLDTLLLLSLVLFALVVLRVAEQIDWFHMTLIYTFLAAFYAIWMLAVLEGRFAGFNAFLRSRFLVFSGLISYGMYMYHQAVNGLMHAMVYGHDKPQITGMDSAMVTCASLLLLYGLGWLSYQAIERPIRNWGHRFHYPSPKKHK